MCETRNSNLLVKIIVFVVICCCSFSAHAKYGGGAGEPNDPYLIYTAEQMNAIGIDSNDWDKNFKLMADIDLSVYTGTSVNIIGYRVSSSDYKAFTGVFDGNGHTISNFTWNSTDYGNHIGLFIFLGDGGHIKDLLLEDVNIIAADSYYVGSLVGANYGGTIQDCYASGNVTASSSVGGLVGNNSTRGIIKGCLSATNVSGQRSVGGLVGGNYYGAITDCNSTGIITGERYVGGLVGILEGYTGSGTIKACHSNATVSGKYDIGGLLGRNNSGAITNCSAAGSIEGWWCTGGLVGTNTQYSTISDCYSAGSVSGNWFTGGLVGNNWSWATITNCYSASSVYATSLYFGGLVGLNEGLITACYSTGPVSGTVNFSGGLVGGNYGSISHCYSTGFVSGGDWYVGGLVGDNYEGSISHCYSTGDVSGDERVGCLVGVNNGSVSRCYSTGDVNGYGCVGGLVGYNDEGSISNCCSTGDVSGNWDVGGLLGGNGGSISNCYSTGDVSGDWNVGGLAGGNFNSISNCFWDTDSQTHGVTESIGDNQGTATNVAGLPTAQMQKKSTFTDAGWDFTTPIWTIDEGVDYPRLWWELAPVLNAEPEITLGTTNSISWEPVIGNIEYYAECAEDANFSSIIYNTGWITATSYEFTGLQAGKRYFYSVKARNAAGVESLWSNVESSLQCTLADAVQIELEPESLQNENMKGALLNKIDAALKMIEKANYISALSKLEQDILQKTNGCAETGQPDKNDWIITCEQQCEIYPLIIETIENVKDLMGE